MRSPRFLARLPWIGPVLDATLLPELPLRVGAAADPLLGEADAVAVLAGAGQAALAWIVRPASDAGGRFRLSLPPGLWPQGADRMLMVLLYDQWTLGAPRQFPPDWARLSDLDGDTQREVQEAIDALLRKPDEDLLRGFIEHNRAFAPDLTFAVASCQYPAGFLDTEPAEASYERLADFLDAAPRGDVKALLLLGDQVYLDATAGLFDPTAKHDRFDLPYERFLRIKALQHVLRRVPACMMLDDHEIEDNWSPVPGDDGFERNLVEGRRSYFAYQRIAGPDELAPVGDSREPLWYTFTAGRFPFFVADTRTERQARTAETIDLARIMSDGQFAGLLAWLSHAQKDKGDMPKFVASPACFLPRHRRAAQHRHPASALRSDAWDGYPASFYGLLSHIAAHRIRNVVFLSGDEHVSFVVRADITSSASGDVTPVYSVHSSALYSPFPFANAVEESLFCDEDFVFGNYRCRLSSLGMAPGDGFAVLKVSGDKKTWSVRCAFDRTGGAKTIQII